MTLRCAVFWAAESETYTRSRHWAGALTWTEEGLEYEGSDKHRQALLEGLRLDEESKPVNSAAVKLEDVGQEADMEMLDASETKRFSKSGGDVELHELGQVGRAMRCEGGVHEDGESHSRQLEEVEKAGRYLKGVEKVTWMMGAWQNNEEVNVDVHVDSELGPVGPRGSRRVEGMMMINVVAAGDDQVRKSKNETKSRPTKSGIPLNEGESMVSD